MKSLYSGVFLLAVVTAFAAAPDDYVGRFVTNENAEIAVLTLAVDGANYSGSILLDGYSTPVTAKRRRKDLEGELHERDGRIFPFVIRATGIYLIMEFEDGAMIVFRRDEKDGGTENVAGGR